MNLSILFTFILLLPVIYCNKDHHEDHDDNDNTKDWMQFLPSHVQHILKSKTTTTIASNDEISSNIQDSTELLHIGEAPNSSATPEIMYGSNSSSSNKSVPIGVSIGGIIFFFLICYCCFKCCCQSRETISQGVVITPMQPPPPPPQEQPNIVIQHIHTTPHLQPAQPGMVQHVHHTHAPPPMGQPQFHQPPPYPAGYDNRQMIQQEWSPHAPMNQQQYPSQDPYNPSAPPPSYGKY